MAIKANKTGKVPAVLVEAAIKATTDYEVDRNRDTVGTYTEERYSRVVYAVLREIKRNPALLVEKA